MNRHHRLLPHSRLGMVRHRKASGAHHGQVVSAIANGNGVAEADVVCRGGLNQARISKIDWSIYLMVRCWQCGEVPNGFDFALLRWKQMEADLHSRLLRGGPDAHPLALCFLAGALVAQARHPLRVAINPCYGICCIPDSSQPLPPWRDLTKCQTSSKDSSGSLLPSRNTPVKRTLTV